MSHIKMSHVTHVNESVTHVNKSCHTCEQAMPHVRTSPVAHTIHITRTDKACHANGWATSHMRMSHATHTNISHVQMVHTTHKKETCHKCEWVLSVCMYVRVHVQCASMCMCGSMNSSTVEENNLLHLSIHLLLSIYWSQIPDPWSHLLRSVPKCLEHPPGPGQKLIHGGAVWVVGV